MVYYAVLFDILSYVSGSKLKAWWLFS